MFELKPQKVECDPNGGPKTAHSVPWQNDIFEAN